MRRKWGPVRIYRGTRVPGRTQMAARFRNGRAVEGKRWRGQLIERKGAAGEDSDVDNVVLDGKEFTHKRSPCIGP